MPPRFSVLLAAAVVSAALTLPRSAMTSETSPAHRTAAAAPAEPVSAYSSVKTLDTSRAFPTISSLSEWKARRERIRQRRGHSL